MSQQRLTERLSSYWSMHRNEGICPEFQRISKASIADVWPSCLVIKLQPSGESGLARYQFAEIGELARSIFKDDPTGQYFTTNMKVMPAARLIRRIGELEVTSEPLMDEGQFVNEKNKIVKFRSCLLPFGSNGKVTHVLAGLSWREF